MCGTPQDPREAILASAQKMLDGGFPVDAVPYYAEAAALYVQANDLAGAARCYERIGYCYEFDCRWPEAIEWYFKAQETFGKAGDVTQASRAGAAAEYARSQATT